MQIKTAAIKAARLDDHDREYDSTYDLYGGRANGPSIKFSTASIETSLCRIHQQDRSPHWLKTSFMLPPIKENINNSHRRPKPHDTAVLYPIPTDRL